MTCTALSAVVQLQFIDDPAGVEVLFNEAVASEDKLADLGGEELDKSKRVSFFMHA